MSNDLVLTQVDLLELAQAVKVIERHYPEHEIHVVSKNGTVVRDTKRKRVTPAKARRGRPPKNKGGGKNRKQVADAANGKWLTMGQIIDATGLTKTQVHGAMLGKDGPFVFERKLIDDTKPNGPKMYRLKGT